MRSFRCLHLIAHQMMSRKKSPFWDYLDASGVLEKGSDDEIKAVKKAYRKKYFTEYKRKRRGCKKEFTVLLEKSTGELSRIEGAAQRHKLSVPAFMKSAANAYLERTYIVPNRLMIANLEQMISNCLNEIKAIAVKREKFWEREQKLELVEICIVKLETKMNEVFRNPALYDHQNQIA